jgi:hypothetical protein
VEDVDKLLLHSGVALADYPSDEHVQRLVKSPDLSPIVCTVQVEKDEPDRLAGRFVIYDGWPAAIRSPPDLPRHSRDPAAT